MSLTRRQTLRARLTEGPCTVRGLAEEQSLRVAVVLDDLEHLTRSLRRDRLEVEPAECLACGFVFRKRKRLSAPSAAPAARARTPRSPC